MCEYRSRKWGAVKLTAQYQFSAWGRGFYAFHLVLPASCLELQRNPKPNANVERKAAIKKYQEQPLGKVISG